MSNFDYLSLSGQHLLVFVTLHEVGTVTATADTLSMTQSAVSHSLQKMREIFNDELFIRAGRSVTPTLRSEQIYPEIKSVLTSLNTLTQSQTFNPETAVLNYRIFANDFQSDLFFAKLYALVSKQVRSLSLDISPSKRPTLGLLRSADIDLALSPIAPDSSDIMATRIFTDTSHCFYDPRVRSAPQSIDDLHVSQFVSLTFIKGISLGGKTSKTIKMLDKNTCIRVANFASIPAFIHGTELLAVMPSLLSKTATYQGLAHVPLPYEVSPLNMYMLWHKKYQKDAKHSWFRQQVLNATAFLRENDN